MIISSERQRDSAIPIHVSFVPLDSPPIHIASDTLFAEIEKPILNQNWKRHMYVHHSAALFTTARTWKQPRCPLADEWIRKLWYTVEYYSAIKKNVFESVLMRWMKLEPIVQSEVSQKEKHQYINAYIWNLERW